MQRKSTLILLTSITLVIGLLAVGTVKVVGDAHRPSQSTVTTKKVVSKTLVIHWVVVGPMHGP
ncbi:hypothetical protein WP50_14375 [Lactiplantibacillus plantarum]|nr:hypothetical protein WP50_14375 [Lactiplantibacillus plantarum]